MSSFGTEKVESNDVNLGFPDPYSYWYSQTGRGKQFMPEQPLPTLNVPIGLDLQAHWHQQKKRDADYMAGAKVRSTHMMNARAFSSPHGYYAMPPPVLGQRRFANPSMGYLDTASARQDTPGLAPFSETTNPYVSQFGRLPARDWSMEGARLSGGVLRTTVGQQWGHAKLKDRINQFNAIDAAKQAFTLEQGMMGVPTQAPTFAGAEGSFSEELGVLPQVELAQLLQGVIDALMSPGDNLDSISRFVVGDANKIFSLCVRLATSNSSSDIMNALEFIEGGSSSDGITQLIQDLLLTHREDPDDPLARNISANIKILDTLLKLFTRLEQYLKQMLKLADSPAKDRQAASKNLVKSLGFLSLIKTDAQLMAQVGNANQELLAHLNADAARAPQRSGAFIAPEGREGVGFFPSSYKGVAKGNLYRYPIARDDDGRGSVQANASSRFSMAPSLREDSQMGFVGNGGYLFSQDFRGAFGDQSGKWLGTSQAPEENQYNTGGRPIGYSGAEDLAASGMGEGDEEEDGALAALAADTTSATPHLRSIRDPVTQNWNVGSPDTELKALREQAEPSAPQRELAPYTEEDVPRGRAQLLQFIQQLREAHPGYQQKVYATGKDRNVRLNTLRNMRKYGLI